MTSIMGRLSETLPERLTSVRAASAALGPLLEEVTDLANGVSAAAMLWAQLATGAAVDGANALHQRSLRGTLLEGLVGLDLTRRIRSSAYGTADGLLNEEIPLNLDDQIDIVRRNMTFATAERDSKLIEELRSQLPVDGKESAPSIRRHRPGSLVRAFHEQVREMALPSEEWLVGFGLDLLQARTLLKQLRGGLFGLTRGAKLVPRAPVKSTNGKSFSRFAIVVGRDEIEVVPELYSKLAVYAAFRERDHALLMTLKGHAITWLKEQEINYRDGYPVVLWASLLAWIPGELDEAVMRITTSPRVQERLAASRKWLNEGVEPHSLGLKSWWDPRYQLGRYSGDVVTARIPRA